MKISEEIARIPFMKIAIAFMAGVVVAGYVTVAWWFELAVILLSALLTVLFKTPLLKNISVVFFLFFAGMTIADINRINSYVPRAKQLIVNLEITDIPVESRNHRWQKTQARIHWYSPCRKDSTQIIQHPSREKIVLYIDTCYNFSMGDVITVRTQLYSIKDGSEEESGYVKVMRMRGIMARSYVSATNVLEVGEKPAESIFYKAKIVQKAFSDKLNQVDITERDKGILNALITGDRAGIDNETREAYSRLGISHILALSGLHLAIIFFILNVLLRPIVFMGRSGYAIKTILIVVVIWGYALMTGLSMSICRAALMLTILQASLFFGSRSNTYNALFIAAFVTLVMVPSAIYDLSFQLSYLAVVSIIFFYPRIHRLCRPPFKILRWFWNMGAVGISAQIGVIPLIIYHFDQLPILSLFANPMIMITTPVIMVAGGAYLVLGEVAFAGSFISGVMSLLFHLQNRAITFGTELSFAAIDNINLPTWGVIACYVAIVIVMICIKLYERKHVPRRIRHVLVPKKMIDK